MSPSSAPSRRSPTSSPPLRSDSVPLTNLSPRASSIASRSPRLGQESFDAATARDSSNVQLASPASRLAMRPRQLFAEAPSEATPALINVTFPAPTSEPASRSSTAGSSSLADEKDPAEVLNARADAVNVLPHVIGSHKKTVSTSSTLTPRLATTGANPSAAAPLISGKPSLRLLFSLTSRWTALIVILPGIACAIALGVIPAYMTELVGQSFQSFTDYTLQTSLPDTPSSVRQAAGAQLLDEIRISAIQFAALAIGTFVFGTLMVSLFVVHGERTARALRLEVYKGVSTHDLAWFETGMGSAEALEEGDEGVEQPGTGAGGLMGRFTKETDDVRAGTSQNVGVVLQNIVAFLACLILSFYRDWRLTLVILASIPVAVLAVVVTERFATRFIILDRKFTAKSTSRLDRVFSAISTVKAYNAEKEEIAGFGSIADGAYTVYNRLSLVWGIRSGVTQFIMTAMFVQGFWFGAYLIRVGLSTVSQVNTCFWACLLAASYLQQCVPLLVTIERAKIAMASLLDLARRQHRAPVPPAADERRLSSSGNSLQNVHQSSSRTSPRSTVFAPDQPPLHAEKVQQPPSPIRDTLAEPFSPMSSHTLATPISPSTPTFIPLSQSQRRRRGRPLAPRNLRKLQPTTFTGELSLRNVSFHYPSRPHPAAPALIDANIYLAARETTYIVGSSGSGKSTVGSLLLGLYRPEQGWIEVDEQGLDWIDEEWLRGHVACVSQGASVLFNGTVHDNVAMGVVGQIQEDGSRRQPRDVSRDEIVNACRGALIHDFIKDLPEGYDTWLSGEKGASLSGGQRQRLAIARAWIRDPTVLILDEATSALDTTSRLLVTEAVKVWRQNRTTIIITHDLTPIDAEDFVYVLENGRVVEQGYRADLEVRAGAFYSLLHAEDEHTVPDHQPTMDDDEALEQLQDAWTELNASVHSTPRIEVHDADAQRVSTGLLGTPVVDLGRASRELKDARRASANYGERDLSIDSSTLQTPPRPPSRSASSTRTSPTASPSLRQSEQPSPRDSSMSFTALELAGQSAFRRRPARLRVRHDGSDLHSAALGDASAPVVINVKDNSATRPAMTLKQLALFYYRTLPSKLMLHAGCFFSIVVGACTPVFSTLLSRLIADLGKPDASSLITTTALLVLLVAFVEGAGTFLKYYLLELCAMGWTTAMRKDAFGRIIKQDKTFFDRTENSTSALSHSVVKDSEDARLWIGTVIGQLVVVASMLVIGLVWAFATGWELTLVGLGMGPIFIVATRLQATMLSKLEMSNKRLREDVSRRFHQTVANIRAIRSMSMQSVFTSEFLAATSDVYAGGVKAGPFAGMCTSTALALTYGGEALLFYVGAVLVANDRYDYAQMAKVFALVIFSVTFASQAMIYIPGVAKATQAATDLQRLTTLSTDTLESRGSACPSIRGNIDFDRVSFAYASRADVPILRKTTFSISVGSCVGIVGSSGSGKSTVTALLQRLYEPNSGTIRLDGLALDEMNVHHLRQHIAVVSQHPALFDMTVAENIAYGNGAVDDVEITRAAKAAHVHDFILSLPQGYSTMLGESASLISGGQAQRLQIARALVRPRGIQIFDECTSALDPANQAAVIETIMAVKGGKTTLIVTHKLAVMERCDYLLVMRDGEVVESGTVDELKSRGGHFSQLASGGEWAQ